MRMTPLPKIDFEAMEREMMTETPVPHNTYDLVEPIEYTAMQIIAHGISRLTWKEAEQMGEAIKAKFVENTSLTAAIQAWAHEWESFK